MTKSCESAKCAHVAEDLLVLSAGICAGAGLMYLCEPRRGRVRRRWLAKRVENLFGRHENGLVNQGKNLFNRVAGLASDAVCAGLPDSEVTDETLAERVRARLSDLVSRPGDVVVEANGGVITLKGTLTLAETHLLRSEVQKIPGVKGLLDVPVSSKLSFAPAIVFGLAAGLAAFARNLRSPSHPSEPKGAV